MDNIVIKVPMKQVEVACKAIRLRLNTLNIIIGEKAEYASDIARRNSARKEKASLEKTLLLIKEATARLTRKKENAAKRNKHIAKLRKHIRVMERDGHQ
jgi:hypothetical protein